MKPTIATTLIQSQGAAAGFEVGGISPGLRAQLGCNSAVQCASTDKKSEALKLNHIHYLQDNFTTVDVGGEQHLARKEAEKALRSQRRPISSN